MGKRPTVTGCILATLLTVTAVAVAQPTAEVQPPPFKLGDTWVFDRSVQRGTVGYNEGHWQLSVDRIDDDSILLGTKPEGSPNAPQEQLRGRDLRYLRNVDGQQTTTGRPVAFPLAVGRTWTTEFTDPPENGRGPAHWRLSYRATGWNDVVTPAGRFHAIHIEAKGQWSSTNTATTTVAATTSTPEGSTTVVRQKTPDPGPTSGISLRSYDYAPEVRQFVKTVYDDYNSENVRTRRTVQTLVSFKLAA